MWSQRQKHVPNEQLLLFLLLADCILLISRRCGWQWMLPLWRLTRRHSRCSVQNAVMYTVRSALKCSPVYCSVPLSTGGIIGFQSRKSAHCTCPTALHCTALDKLTIPAVFYQQNPGLSRYNVQYNTMGSALQFTAYCTCHTALHSLNYRITSPTPRGPSSLTSAESSTLQVLWLLDNNGRHSAMHCTLCTCSALHSV